MIDTDDKPDAPAPDDERNRWTGRVKRYAQVGTSVGGVALRMAGRRVFGDSRREENAAQLAAALGGLKGPLMKVAQFASTIPDLVPPEYAAELAKLLATADIKDKLRTLGMEAMPMGPDEFGSFVKNEVAKWSQVIKAANVKIETKP